MKTDYDKIITHLKIAILQMGEDRKSLNIRSKLRAIIGEVEQLKIEFKKQKINRRIKNDFNFISKNPKKSISIIEDLIEKEIDSLDKKEILDE